MPKRVVSQDLDDNRLVALPVGGDAERCIDLSIGYREMEEDCDVVLSFVAILRDLVVEGRTRGTDGGRSAGCCRSSGPSMSIA